MWILWPFEFLYNAKGKWKVRQFSWNWEMTSSQVFFHCLPPPPPHASFSLHVWWSMVHSTDVSPTQWKHSLMCLCTSRLCSYGKRKNWREKMNFWIGFISFWVFQSVEIEKKINLDLFTFPTVLAVAIKWFSF